MKIICPNCNSFKKFYKICDSRLRCSKCKEHLSPHKNLVKISRKLLKQIISEFVLEHSAYKWSYINGPERFWEYLKKTVCQDGIGSEKLIYFYENTFRKHIINLRNSKNDQIAQYSKKSHCRKHWKRLFLLLRHKHCMIENSSSYCSKNYCDRKFNTKR